MNPFDVGVLAILVLSAFWGGMRGVVAQIATIASWTVSWFVATRYYHTVADLFSESNPWRTPISAVVTFAICAIAIRVVGRFVKKFVSSAGLNEFDRQAGAMFGIIKGGVLCILIAFFAVITSDKTREIVNNSRSGAFFISIIGHIQTYFPDSEIKQRFLILLQENEENATEGSDTIGSDVEKLKSYLKANVLNNSAKEFVTEVDNVGKSETSQQNDNGLGNFVSMLQASTKHVKRKVARLTETEQRTEITNTDVWAGDYIESKGELYRSTKQDLSTNIEKYSDNSYDYETNVTNSQENEDLYGKTTNSGLGDFLSKLTGSSVYSAFSSITVPDQVSRDSSLAINRNEEEDKNFLSRENNNDDYQNSYSTIIRTFDNSNSQSQLVEDPCKQDWADEKTWGEAKTDSPHSTKRIDTNSRRRSNVRTVSSERLSSYSYSASY